MNPRSNRRFAAAGALAAWLACAAGAHAHGGEDHGAPAQAAAALPALAPRAYAQTELFEAVVVLDAAASGQPRLRLSLDRSDSNEPIRDAKVEIELGERAIVAQPDGQGSYLAVLSDANTAAAATRLPLTIAVESAAGADLLQTVLELPAASTRTAAAVGAGAGRRGWVWIAAGGLALLLVLLALALARASRRGRRPSTPHDHTSHEELP